MKGHPINFLVNKTPQVPPTIIVYAHKRRVEEIHLPAGRCAPAALSRSDNRHLLYNYIEAYY